jgi:hypothetical protein
MFYLYAQNIIVRNNVWLFCFLGNSVVHGVWMTALGKCCLQCVLFGSQIWANAFSSERSAGDLVFTDEDSWGTGSQVTTTLYNDKNEVSFYSNGC